MRYSKSIRSIGALLTLVIFLFSITPKRFLHEFFAHHTDPGYTHCIDGHQQKISISGFHCDCNDLVTASPYLFDIPEQKQLFSVPSSSFYLQLQSQVNSRFPSYFSLRGPPSSVL